MATTLTLSQSLFVLTKNVSTVLPREVRDIIYQHILDENQIEEICRCSPMRLDKFPLPHETGPESSEARLPGFADSKTAFRSFADEVIEMLYELHGNLCVAVPSAIPKFLDTDFFDTGFALKAAKLQKIRIEGCLHVENRSTVTADLIDLDTFQSDLDALLSYKWGVNFQLEIVFHSRTVYCDPRHMTTLAHTLHEVWQVLKPFIAQVEDRGAGVHLAIHVRTTTFGNENDAQNMLETEEDWLQYVQKEFQGRYPRPHGRANFYPHSPCPKASYGCMAALCCVFCCCGWVIVLPARWCYTVYKERKVGR